MEAYKKVGRGGAGNFYSKKDIEDVTNAPKTDLEAQASPSNPPSTSPPAQAPPSEYTHTGRGGAGNWATNPASTLPTSESQAKSQTQAPIPTSAPKDQTTSKPTYRGGRGGAGNYIDYAEEERTRKEEEEKIRKEVEEAIGRDVESGLARPERVFDRNGKGGSWEMGDVN